MKKSKPEKGKVKLPKAQRKYYEQQVKKLEPYGIVPVGAIYVKGMKTPAIKISEEDLSRLVKNWCRCDEAIGEPAFYKTREEWYSRFPNSYLLDDDDSFFCESNDAKCNYEVTQFAYADTWFSQTLLGILAYMKASDFGYEFYDDDMEPFERMLAEEGIEDDPKNLKKALERYSAID